MSNQIASISLRRNVWTAIFVAQVWYIYTLIFDRSEVTPESKRWVQLDTSIKEALKTFMPVLKEAAEHSSEMGKLFLI